MTTFLAFVFVFTILVFVHELGHFLAARAVGVRVKEFAFGFPPRLYSKKKGKTTYVVNLLPIGGYVQLLGEQGEEATAKDSLVSKKPWQKALIFAAGVTMNFLLAWFVLTLFYGFGGKGIIAGMTDHKGVINGQKVEVVELLSGGAAEKAGIKKGDLISEINGVRVYAPEDLTAKVQASNGQVTLKIETDGQSRVVALTPKTEKVSGQEVKRIGVAMASAGKVSAPWYLAPVVAAQETVRITKMTFVEFGKFLGLAFKTGKLSEGVGGPIAIVKVTGVAASLGFAALIQLLIMLSISLGVLNILPFPALDGGHLLFLGIEKLAGREIPKKVKDTINQAGFVLLLILIAWITFKDLGRFGILK